MNKIRPKLLGGIIPEGKVGLKVLGYKNYVGGRWEEIGKLQFDFLVSQGLKPCNTFLDIGCGALRGGKRFIEYLNKGNYLGIDKEKDLIKTGIEKVLGDELYREKNPEFVISDSFEFGKFSKKPEYALALSLFTHLTSKDITLCLSKLRKLVNLGHVFYATFFEGESEKNPLKSHSLDHFDYFKEEMVAFGKTTGWDSEYIGNWNHPRKQMMIKYIAK
jgi:SAM-dependent methyltransferase